MKINFATIVLALIGATSAVAQANKQEIGGWTVTETTDSEGSGVCILSSESGEPRLQLVAGGQEGFDGRVRFTFSKPIITGESGTVSDAKFNIDSKSWTVDARWVYNGSSFFLSAPLGESQEDVLPLISRGYKLTVSLFDNVYVVDLKGSAAAINAYSGCLTKNDIS